MLVAVPLALCGVVAGIFPVFESDLFWHLAAGRWILEHGALPRTDPFRFTSGGAPWVDHEWLFQLLVRGVEALGGLDALILLRALALGGFALLLFAGARRAGLAAGLAGLLALGATLGVRPRFLVRPEIVTLYGIVLLLQLLERALLSKDEGPKALQSRGLGAVALPEGAGGSGSAIAGAGSVGAVADVPGPGGEALVRAPSVRVLAALVALVVVWVQCHGEAMLAPGLAALFGLGAVLGAPAGARRSRAVVAAVLGVPALLGAALLVNPYGWRLVAVLSGIGRALADLPAVNPEWASAWAAPQPYLFGGLAMVAALALAARRAAGRWPRPALGLPTLALALLALAAVRHQALFYAAAAPYAARCLVALPETRALGERARRRWAMAAIVATLSVTAWAAHPPASGPLRPRHGGLAWGFGLAPGRFPVHAARVLAAHPELGPLYNEFVHGGYLLWRLFPPRQVFLDGRMELDPELLHETAAARRSADSWDALLAREGAVGALVRYEEKPVPVVEPDGAGGFRAVALSTANALLFPRPRWQLADWDDETQLFLRPGTPGWDGEPYRFVEPEDVAAMLTRAAQDSGYRAGVIAELERKLAGEPDCRRARQLRDALANLP